MHACMPIPVLDRYNGLLFRVVKKLKRGGKFPKDVQILIVSSKFGLVSPSENIPYPDELMSFETARQKRKNFLDELKRLFEEREYSEIFVNLGSTYLRAIQGIEEFTEGKVIYASGRLACMQAIIFNNSFLLYLICDFSIICKFRSISQEGLQFHR